MCVKRVMQATYKKKLTIQFNGDEDTNNRIGKKKYIRSSYALFFLSLPLYLSFLFFFPVYKIILYGGKGRYNREK